VSAVSESGNQGSRAYPPDFSAAGTVLIVVLIAELIAILLTLASGSQPGLFLVELARNSLFILWLAILSAVIMCLFHKQLESAGKTRAFVLSFLLLEGLCLGLAELSFRLGWFFPGLIGIHDAHASFILRTFAISSIVIPLVIRYLYVASEWRRSIVIEAHARISALQALMRPHFLFNSMDTIASLTRTDPRQAEAAVEDLSDLLRANLTDSGERTTLAEELEVTAIYQRIEQLRLGEWLTVRWNVNKLPLHAPKAG
jgi:two-component system sensor histidine kinase AlgZ